MSSESGDPHNNKTTGQQKQKTPPPKPHPLLLFLYLGMYPYSNNWKSFQEISPELKAALLTPAKNRGSWDTCPWTDG